MQFADLSMINKDRYNSRILLVDDDEHDYILIRDMLISAQEGKYQLEWATTYEAGRDALKTGSFDSVLMNYDLGVHSGIELIQEAVSNHYPAPILLLSGRGHPEADIEALRAGAADYLHKDDLSPHFLERSIRYSIERRRMENELAHRLQDRVDILESIQDGFFAIDRDWRVIYINHRAAQNMGLTANELVGKNILEAFPKMRNTLLEKNYQKVMAERTPMQFEMRGVYKGQWYSISVYPTAAGISIYWQDITERKRTQEDLRTSEARFNKAFNATPNALVISHLENGLIQEVNDAFINLFGYSRAEVIGKTSLELHMFANPTDREDAIKRLRADQFVRDFEIAIRTKDGEVRQASLSVETLSIDGEMYMLTIIQDTTERKETEAALHQANEEAAWLARFPSENPNPVARVSATGIVLYHNSAAANLSGWALQVGQPLPDLLLPEIQYCIDQGQWVQKEIAITGSYYLITFMPFPEEGYVNLYASDITDRKQAEETLAHQAKLLDLVHDAIFVMDDQMNVTYWNQAAEKLYGWSKEEAFGQNAPQLVRSELTEEERKQLIRQSQETGGYQGEVIHHTKEGSILVIEARMSVQKDPTGRVVGYLTANRDVTDRKQAEEALRASEEKFARAFQSNPAGMSITRAADARYIDVNQSFCKLVGYSREELLGHTSVELGLYSEETREAFAMQQYRETGSIHQLEFPLTSRDGSKHTLLFSLDPIEVAGETCNLATLIDITERKKVAEAHAQIQLQRLLMEQREQDRQAIARDIHDGPVQDLSGLIFNIQFAKEAISDLATQVELENIRQSLKNTTQELRNIINELRPPSLIRFGLGKAMNVFLEDFRESHPEIEVEVSLMDDGNYLSEQARLSLYRILQEALNNVVRHSNANRVAVALLCEDHQIAMEIRDNGKGFSLSNNLANYSESGHYGLVGMKERTEAVGGTLDIISIPEKGTTIRVIVPQA